MEEILVWIETQKSNILLVTTPLLVVFLIGVGICIASSKRGFEDNKPWLKNIIIGGFIILFAATLVTLLFG